MKPVMQTRVGADPNAPGNCFSACVASIFEVELADLPDEAKIVEEIKAEVGIEEWSSWGDRYKWGKSWGRLWMETQKWVCRRGMVMVEVKAPILSETPPGYDPWCIISAKSPRNIEHAVVGRGATIVHDPHPFGGGVSEADRTYVFFVSTMFIASKKGKSQ